MLVGLLTLVTVPLALGAPAGRYRRQATTKTVSDASSLNGQTFDYVIAGGGLGGVVLASRLSEDSKVLLIEVGESQENNDIITGEI
jgi:NADH dehydrogenase FAD-containing subunit